MNVIEKFKAREDVVFAFVGEGTIREKLVQYKEKHNLQNVKFIPYQDKSDLIYSLNAGDVHWCLNAKGIKGVSVPSKLYGIIAAGKPILGALEEGSEARLIIEETQCGYVTEPGNYEQIEVMIQKYLNEKEGSTYIEMSQWGRTYLVENLTKDVSINKYVNEIKSC